MRVFKRRLNKRGSESPTDITELFFALLFIAIGLSLLFIPATCKKSADKKRVIEDIVLIDASRDILYLLYEPVGQMTVADAIILGVHDQTSLDVAKKQIRLRLDENNAGFPWQQIMAKTGSKEILNEGSRFSLIAKKNVPIETLLPAIDGSMIRIETKVTIGFQKSMEPKI